MPLLPWGGSVSKRDCDYRYFHGSLICVKLFVVEARRSGLYMDEIRGGLQG